MVEIILGPLLVPFPYHLHPQLLHSLGADGPPLYAQDIRQCTQREARQRSAIDSAFPSASCLPAHSHSGRSDTEDGGGGSGFGPSQLQPAALTSAATGRSTRHTNRGSATMDSGWCRAGAGRRRGQPETMRGHCDGGLRAVHCTESTSHPSLHPHQTSPSSCS